MNFQRWVFCGIGALLLAGLSWVGPGARGPREGSATEADGLVGGVACAYFKASVCPYGVVNTSGCPLNAGFIGGGDRNYAKSSGTVWCGCVTDCSREWIIKGIYDIGCGSA